MQTSGKPGTSQSNQLSELASIVSPLSDNQKTTHQLTDTSIAITMLDVNPEDYAEVLTDVLETAERRPRIIRDSLATNGATTHESEKIFLFNTTGSVTEWLPVTLAYNAKKKELYITIEREKSTSEKLTRLVQNIEEHYNDPEDQLNCSFQEIIAENYEETVDDALPHPELHQDADFNPATTSEDVIENKTGPRKSSDPMSAGSDSERISTSSGTGYAESKGSALLLIDINVTENHNLEIIAGSKVRPKTRFGELQNEHIIAYGLFIRGILGAVDNSRIEELPKILIASTKYYLPEIEHEKLKEIESYYNELKDKKCLSRPERKKITSTMRRSGQFSQEQIDAVKDGLKANRALFILQLVKKLISQIITVTNRHEETSFTGPAPKSAKELGQEGSRVNLALQALQSFDKLLRSSRSETKKEEALQEIIQSPFFMKGLRHFKNAEIKSIIQRLLEKQSLPDEEPQNSIKTSLRSADPKNNSTASSSASFFNSDPIPMGELYQLIGHLFDFNYHRQMAAHLLEAFRNDLTGPAIPKNSRKEISTAIQTMSQETPADILKTIKLFMLQDPMQASASSSNNLLGLLQKITVGLSKNTLEIEELFEETERKLSIIFIKSCAKHFGFITAAFSGIKQYLETPALTERYVSVIIRQQEWDNGQFITEDRLRGNIEKDLKEKFLSVLEVSLDQKTEPPNPAHDKKI